MTAARSVVTGGAVITPSGVVHGGHVIVEADRIVDVGGGRPSRDGAAVLDARGGWIAPGFIDAQINGAHGIDVTTQPGRIDDLARTLPRYGVTSFLPTVITCSAEQRAAVLAAWDRRTATVAGAQPLGLHIEGPMLAPVRRGAHPEALLVRPDLALIEGWSDRRGVAMVTLAPELPGAIEVVSALADRGVVVSIGHTDCSAEQFAVALAAGATYVTHLFNAMRPFSHRDPGPIGAALADTAVIAGLICDGIHVDPVAVRMAWNVLGPDRLNLVTDAIAALGATADGSESMSIGSVDVTIDGTGVRTAGGVLAGSVLSLDEALRNLVAFTGCSVPDAVRTVTATPARLLGLADRGHLSAGARADITVLDSSLHVRTTIVGGEVTWRS